MLEKYDEETIEKMINRKFDLPFHNTSEFTFEKLLDDSDGLAKNLGNYMAGFSGPARNIIEKFKFEEEIEKLDAANRLCDIFKKIAAQDIHPNWFDNIGMGYIFEGLVRICCLRVKSRFTKHVNSPKSMTRPVVCAVSCRSRKTPYANKTIKPKCVYMVKSTIPRHAQYAFPT